MRLNQSSVVFVTTAEMSSPLIVQPLSPRWQIMFSLSEFRGPSSVMLAGFLFFYVLRWPSHLLDFQEWPWTPDPPTPISQVLAYFPHASTESFIVCSWVSLVVDRRSCCWEVAFTFLVRLKMSWPLCCCDKIYCPYRNPNQFILLQKGSFLRNRMDLSFQ